MSKYTYRVCGWRYQHVEWKTPSLVLRLPHWLVAYIKRDPKAAKRFWHVERVYTREEQ
jgi:hypothetical protein